MTFNQKILLASTVTLSLFSGIAAQAEELGWTPRTVDEIKSDIVNRQESSTYVIQYGDTLSTISEAMGIDMNVLVNTNQIANLDLIFPETILKTTVDQNNQVTSVEIQVPSANEEAVIASADLTTNEVTVADETIQVDDLTAPVEAVTSESSQAVLESATSSSEVSMTDDQVSSESSDQISENLLASSEVALEATPSSENHLEASSEEVTTSTASSESMTTVSQAISQVVSATASTSTSTVQTASSSVASTSASVAANQSQVAATSTATQSATSASTNAANAGLQPQVAAYKEEVASRFGITSFSLYRPGSDDHGKGLAVDFMVPVSSSLGDQVAQDAINNMSSRGISYVIWKQRFYAPYNSIYGPAYTWNPMPDRGGVTANHYDHVHVSFNG
ncbi:LysM domain-containing protein [Streptococcus acidominimus]|uniref:LysM domain-containing protein n=1 Tax=Streptococcus acidominimus TaxID=1326 RepID=A0A239WDN7_STRAI|nr:LysM domain-containing protein [Streptococcus acidominimus]SNV31734.1 LysM domain-containing protein [Streptococcus acidominimus]